jgi:hypothetical protein
MATQPRRKIEPDSQPKVPKARKNARVEYTR